MRTTYKVKARCKDTKPIEDLRKLFYAFEPLALRLFVWWTLTQAITYLYIYVYKHTRTRG